MKKTIFLAVLISAISVSAYAEKVRVYTDYTPVRILKLGNADTNFEVEAGKSNLKGAFKDVDLSELPNNRADRNAWKWSNGRVKVDENLKAQIEAKKAGRNASINKLKDLGLDDNDLKNLGILKGGE